MKCDWCGRFRSDDQIDHMDENMHLTLYGDLIQTWELVCKECWAKHLEASTGVTA